MNGLRFLAAAASITVASWFCLRAAWQMNAASSAVAAKVDDAGSKRSKEFPALVEVAPAHETDAAKPVAVVKSSVVPKRSPVRLRWEVTRPARLTGQKSDYDETIVRDIAVDWSGTRALTLTRQEVTCWDARTGTRLQTIRPNANQRAYISPDARTVVLATKDGKEFTVLTAATGQKIGTYRTPKGQECKVERYTPTFTPAGEYLLFAVRPKKNLDLICALSTRNATARVLTVKREWARDDYEWQVLAPLPAHGVYLRQTFHMGVWCTDLKTGRERKIECVDFEPALWQTNVGLKVSPDGRYLSARSFGQLKVIDWKADKSIIKDKSTPRFEDEWFTPDAKRIAVLRRTEQLYEQTPPGGWLQLYDIATNDKLSEFIMDHHGLDGLSALAFHRDGRSFVMADRTTHVAVVDFQGAFGVPALPPAAPGSDAIPLR